MKGIAERGIDDICRHGHADIFRGLEFEIGSVESMIAGRAANDRVLIFAPGEMFPEFIDSHQRYSFSKSVCAANETRSSRSSWNRA